MSFVGGCCHLHKGEIHGIHHCRLSIAKRYHARVQLLGGAKPSLRNCVHTPRYRRWMWFVCQVFPRDVGRLRPYCPSSGKFCGILPSQGNVAWHNHHKIVKFAHQVVLKIVVQSSFCITLVRIANGVATNQSRWCKIAFGQIAKNMPYYAQITCKLLKKSPK